VKGIVVAFVAVVVAVVAVWYTVRLGLFDLTLTLTLTLLDTQNFSTNRFDRCLSAVSAHLFFGSCFNIVELRVVQNIGAIMLLLLWTMGAKNNGPTCKIVATVCRTLPCTHVQVSGTVVER